VIKAIIFDCFGVLRSDIYVIIKNKYPELRTDPELVARLEELGARADLGLLTSEDRRKYMATLLDSMGVDGEAEIKQAFSEVQTNVELLSKIKKLRGKLKTGLLSNTSPGFWNYFSKDELNEYFNEIVLSYEVGARKPDEKVFELAAERLGVLAIECVFVDDQEKNVKVAKSCGMEGVLYEWGMDIEAAIQSFVVL